ncbi:hypothetical protein ACS0TY_002883 [Phlomoides rotata]
MEYFQPPIIHALASALGAVIKLDDRTRDRSMCHYARVLIELDMKHNFEDFVMFETKDHYSCASVKYESLPPFCNGCGIVGHNLVDCRGMKTKTRVQEIHVKAPSRPLPKAKPPSEVWIQKGSVNNDTKEVSAEGVECHNSFAALGEDMGDIHEEPSQALAAVAVTEEQGQDKCMGEKITHIDLNAKARDTNPSSEAEAAGSDTGSSRAPANKNIRATTKKGKKTANVQKEYNLRNKPSTNASTSMPTDDSYVVTSDINNKALASMRLAAGKSWADAAEEPEYRVS